MPRHTTLVFTLAIALAIILAAAGFAGAGPLARPLLQGGAPTVVSYQGQVTVAGTPYTGDGYFKFAVVDQAGTTSFWSNDGTSAGGGQPTDAVKLGVSNGLFNVLLGDAALAHMTALPASAFAGTERYLRVWFSSNNINFTRLAPDRRIAAVPYALQAQEARTAATASDADTLDTLHATAFQQHYANVVVVAKSGGDFTTINDALNSITDASDTNRYLAKVMPGVYTEQVTMKPYVDIEGSGELATRITDAGSAGWDTGTVVGANNAELRFLTVVNTGGNTYANAIFNDHAAPRLTHVTATASGGIRNYGVSNSYSSPTMQNVTATASGGDRNHGVWNTRSSPTMQNVTASASGGTISRGVVNGGYPGDLSSPTMQHVTASASGGESNVGVYNSWASTTMREVIVTASGGRESLGVWNENSSPTMTNVTASASGGTDMNYGVSNHESSPTMQNVTASVSGGVTNIGVKNYSSSTTIQNSSLSASGGTSNYGVYSEGTSGSYMVRINNSQVTASTATIRNFTDSTTLVLVGASQLAGGAVTGDGVTCAGVYDEDYTFYASTCP